MFIANNGVSSEATQLFTLTVTAKSNAAAAHGSLDAATHDAALMAVLADSSGGTTDTGTKKGPSVSDPSLSGGV